MKEKQKKDNRYNNKSLNLKKKKKKRKKIIVGLNPMLNSIKMMI